MNQRDIIRPIPAAVLADLSSRDRTFLENRIKRGFQPVFRTRAGHLIGVKWSTKGQEFLISNSVSTATAWTSKAAFSFIAMMNKAVDQSEVAA